jgi:hypothetical protein
MLKDPLNPAATIIEINSFCLTDVGKAATTYSQPFVAS